MQNTKQYSHRVPARSGLLIAMVVLMIAATAAVGLADFHDTRPGTAQAMVLETGKETVLRFNGMKRVVIVDSNVADVTVLSSDDLLVTATNRPLVKDQLNTMLYVYDREGLHKFAITVVGYRLAEKIARELEQSLGPNLSVHAVSDTMVVVEGEVANNAALENLETMLEAASTDEVQVVSMVTTPEETEDSPAKSAAAILDEILDSSLEVKAWGDDVVVVEGQVADEAAAVQARDTVSTIAGDRLRVVDRIVVAGEDLADRAPARQIQRILGEQFTVTALRGNLVAVEGTVPSQEELDRVNRLLQGFEDVQVINMIAVVPPKPDLAAARQALQGALDDSIRVTQVGEEALMLEGSVPSEERLEQVNKVLSLFENLPIVNVVNVVEPDRRQVLAAVKVLEVTRGGDEELGIDWGQYEGSAGDAAFRAQPFLFGQVSGSNGWPELYNFANQVHALISSRRARLLAEPNLLVNEEEEAEILIGGEIPVPISQGGVGGYASITVDWKPFGVNLRIKPTISPDSEKIKLAVEPEVSSLDFANGVNVAGLTIPALRTRRTQTTVTVPDGGVLAIGGLINSDQSKSVSKLPILGDLPIIGQFFRHDTAREDHSELIILVLPQILGEDGQPLHPIPVPEGVDPGEVMQFGTPFGEMSNGGQ